MNERPRYLVMVTTNNNNKYYKQIPNGDGTWTAEYGRVGATPQKRTYDMYDYEKKYREKINKGYVDQTHLIEDLIEEKKPASKEQYKEIEDKAIAEIVKRLQEMANRKISENYTISSEAVTQAMVDKAQKILVELLAVKTIPAFNSRLMELFETIPRKMNNVNEYLAKGSDDFAKIIQREQDLLDIMQGQVYVKKPVLADDNDNKEEEKQTVLEANGLLFEACTAEDIAIIKEALGTSVSKFKNAWKVTNIATQKRYNDFVKENNIAETKLLFHGSRNENWWSIINMGLLLKPTNVIITGKLYGNGTYFAPKAQKSIGYTSLEGSYWAGGRAKTGFLGLMEVAYGTPYDVYDFDPKFHTLNYEGLQKFKKGANCLHAHAGASMGYSSLRNDEIVIYKEEQCTIKYLVEIQN